MQRLGRTQLEESSFACRLLGPARLRGLLPPLTSDLIKSDTPPFQIMREVQRSLHTHVHDNLVIPLQSTNLAQGDALREGYEDTQAVAAACESRPGAARGSQEQRQRQNANQNEQDKSNNWQASYFHTAARAVPRQAPEYDRIGRHQQTGLDGHEDLPGLANLKSDSRREATNQVHDERHQKERTKTQTGSQQYLEEGEEV